LTSREARGTSKGVRLCRGSRLGVERGEDGRAGEAECSTVCSLRCKCMRFYLEPKSLIGMHFEHGVFICPYDL
jgi:hypothetical protein